MPPINILHLAAIRWPNCGLVPLSYSGNAALAKCIAGSPLELLKSRDRGSPHRQRLTRRDVVVAVGGRPVMPVEQVLDVELHAPVFVDLAVQRGVEADEARQPDRVVRRGK